MRRLLFASLILAVVLAVPACGPSSPRDHIVHDDRFPLRFGVHPFVDPALLQKAFTPLTVYLGEKLERPVALVIANSLEHLTALCDQGVVDIGWTAPQQEEGAALEVVGWPRAADPADYRIALVVGAAAAGRDLEAMKGTRLGMVDRRSWSGSAELADLMAERGLSLATHFGQIDALGNHEEVLRRLEEGRCDVGAVIELALRSRPASGGTTEGVAAPLPAGPPPHVIAVTRPLGFEPICAARALPAELRERVRRSLLELGADPAARPSLDALRQHLSLTGFAARPR